MSCSSIGPRGPAVSTFWLSGTGAPAAVVSLRSTGRPLPVVTSSSGMGLSVCSRGWVCQIGITGGAAASYGAGRGGPRSISATIVTSFSGASTHTSRWETSLRQVRVPAPPGDSRGSHRQAREKPGWHPGGGGRRGPSGPAGQCRARPPNCDLAPPAAEGKGWAERFRERAEEQISRPAPEESSGADRRFVHHCGDRPTSEGWPASRNI